MKKTIITLSVLALCLAGCKDGKRHHSLPSLPVRKTQQESPFVRQTPQTQTTTVTKDCPKCSGYGTVLCPKCHGEECFYRGDTEYECDRCGGSGLPTSSNLMTQVGGYATGKVDCSYCNGSGKIQKTVTIPNR